MTSKWRRRLAQQRLSPFFYVAIGAKAHTKNYIALESCFKFGYLYRQWLMVWQTMIEHKDEWFFKKEEKIFKQKRTPLKVITDQGTEFSNRVVKSLFKKTKNKKLHNVFIEDCDSKLLLRNHL